MYNILKFIVSLLSLALLTACADSDLGFDSVEEGRQATLTVKLKISPSAEISRADMAPGIDMKVTSIWVGAYNANSGRLVGSKALTGLSASLDHTVTHEVTLTTLSGPTFLVGVANFENRTAVLPDGSVTELEAALSDADTLDKFRNIANSFDSEGGIIIAAPLNPPLMSGFYTEQTHTDGSRPTPASVNVRPGETTLSGAIHLRRLISQVKFNVTADASTVRSFSLESWQIINVPTTSWLYEHVGLDPVNAPDDRAVNGRRFVNSAEMTEMRATGDRTYSFDFWQLENKRTGTLPPGTTADNAYNNRSLQYKNADGTNSGKFRSLVGSATSDDPNNRATYVLLNVRMEMAVDENGNKPDGERLVSSTYLIHLGFCEGDDVMSRATDFNCRRNTKYTYNVTIRNVNDIVVEASGNEVNPGVEGIVTDITDNYYTLDAHYSVFNIYLSSSDISNFQYYVVAYDLNGNEVRIDSDNPPTVPAQSDERFRYMSWIELRKTTNASTIAAYKPRSDSETYTLDEVRGKLSAGYYTVFVNEYVYEDDTSQGNEKGSLNWRGYVDRPDRRAWLNVAGSISPDGNSIYYKSKYAVSQASIQTYYNSLAESAMGLETTNESLGLNLRCNTNYDGTGNPNSGRYNIYSYLSGKSSRMRWNTFIQNSFQQVNTINNQDIYRAARTEPLPAIVETSGGDRGGTMSSSDRKFDADLTSNPRYIEAITACLNRNRDLDGDGVIDNNEIRWFVPTVSQILSAILGRRALANPIFEPKVTRVPNKNVNSNQENSSMLMYASDGKMVWLMEGVSWSNWRQWGGGAPWEVRCVRNLGGDMTVINTTNVTQVPFVKRDGANVVELKYFDSRAVRAEAYRSSAHPMPVHDINDQRYNRCYRAFEYYTEAVSLNDSRLGISGKTIEWGNYLSTVNPCAFLEATTGRRGWRVPNQKELTIIAILNEHTSNVPSDNVYQLTCSYSYFDFDGYIPGANPNDPAGTASSNWRFPMKIVTATGAATQHEPMTSYTVSDNEMSIRCVRDTD